MFHLYEVVVRGAGVEIKAWFAGFPCTVPITTIFECEYISGPVSKKFVDGGPVGDISCVSVKSQKREFGVFIGNPPAVEFGAIGGG